MTSHKTRAIRWIAVLAILGLVRVSMANEQDVNKFDLKNIEVSDQIIDSVTDQNFLELSEDEDEAYRALLTRQLLEGQRPDQICRNIVGVDCEEQLRDLSGNGKLREILNRGKGTFARISYTPQAHAYQVQNIYSVRVREDNKGLALYIAVSGDGLRKAGLKGFPRAVGLLKEEYDDNHVSGQAGVIYLLKFR